MSQAKPTRGPKVLVIDIVEAVDPLTDLDQACARKEVGRDVVAVAQVAKDVVAQSKTEGQAGFDLPIVLNVKANRILHQVAMSVAEGAVGIVSLAQQQLFDGFAGSGPRKLKCSN